MDNRTAFDPKSWREELDKLFGFRWDTLVEWALISWLSIWFWLLNDRQLVFDSGGPVTGVEQFLGALDVASPQWLTSWTAWLQTPERAWLLQVFMVVAAVSCVASLRSYSLSGLRTLALASAALACEMDGSLLPVLKIIGFAAIPAFAAMATAILEKYSKNPVGREREFFLGHILDKFFVRIVALYLMPGAAPALFLLGLVGSFKSTRPYAPVEELNDEVVRSLWNFGGKQADAGQETQLAALAAIHLAGNTSRDALRIANGYRGLLRASRGAAPGVIRISGD